MGGILEEVRFDQAIKFWRKKEMSDVNTVRDKVGIKHGVVSEEGQCHSI